MFNSNTTILDFKTQEYFGWVGNVIFITAQVSQVFHTYKVKRTSDISYILQFLLLVGNMMYTTFGYLDQSFSMFWGNLLTVFTAIIQISQKIYYDRRNTQLYGIYDEIL
jgi:uncharacterized protein with PQ loop repeat